MSDSSFPVRSSILLAEAICEQVLPRYPLSRPMRCQLISHGLNDTYRVDAGDALYFFRVSPHGWRSREELEAEAAVVGDLRRSGVRVSPVLPRDDGEYVTRLAAPEGVRYGMLFASAGTGDAREITVAQSRAYGRLAAAVHTVADRSPVVYPRLTIDAQHLLDEPLAAIRSALPNTEDLAFLETVADRVRRRLDELPRTSPDFGFCHGDLHPGNIRFDADGQLVLFDFDCGGYGWRAYDLTIFLWNAFGERRPKHWRESRWRAFRRGYQETRPLPDALDEALPLFLAARQIWLMGLDCGGASGWPPQWLTAEYLQDMVRPVRGWTAEYRILAE